jgi:hypothetical protein
MRSQLAASAKNSHERIPEMTTPEKTDSGHHIFGSPDCRIVCVHRKRQETLTRSLQQQAVKEGGMP